jgi:hypothetical protein
MPEYKIGKYSKANLKLSQLELDLENFRIGKQSNQADAVRAMLTRGSTKVLGLAESIRSNGFHDLELPCVFLNDNTGHYTVAEGNRRVTVLKALSTPELANATPLHNKFKQLSSELNGSLPKQIECAVFEDRKGCLAYVLSRHGYGADGAGLMKWDAISKLRADKYVNGTKHPELGVVDFVLNKGTLGQDAQQKLDDDDFKITNLQRIVDDASVKKLLGLETNDVAVSVHGVSWLVAVWQRVVEIIIAGQHRNEKFTVDKNINDSALRNTFILEVIEDVHGTVPIVSGPSISLVTTTAPPNNQTVAAKKSAKKASLTKTLTTKERKGLIPKSFTPEKLEPQKVINIVDELKKLNVSDFNNSSSVMFRVFLELSIVHYMKKKKIKAEKPHKKNLGEFIEMSLREKISSVAKYLEMHNVLKHNETKALRDLNSATHPISAESLNAYVHSSSVTSDPNTLKTSWDNLQQIFTILWNK